MLRNLKYFVILLLFIPLARAPIPFFFPVCLRDDPELSDCIVRAIKFLQPRLITGDFGNEFWIPKIDPFYIPKLTYGSDNMLKITILDGYARGGGRFKIEKLYVDIKDLRFDVILKFPRIDMRSDYKMKVNLFGAPLYSEGKMYEVLTNVKIRAILKGNLYTKNGQQYVKFDPIYIKILDNTINFIDFTNFLPQTTFLGPFVKNLVVNNVEFLKKNIYPFFEKVFSDTFTRIANQVATQGSFDEIFPY
ncbi:hypothetical protein ACKWTF_016385 [Chironomus riparius]